MKLLGGFFRYLYLLVFWIFSYMFYILEEGNLDGLRVFIVFGIVIFVSNYFLIVLLDGWLRIYFLCSIFCVLVGSFVGWKVVL